MKKTLSVVLALVMLFAVCVAAFAATEPTDIGATGSGTVMVVTSTKTETGEDAADYKVKIPADTTVAWGAPSTDVSFTVESHLTRDKVVAVTVTGSGEMKTVDGAYKLAYTLDGATDFTAKKQVIYPAEKQALSVLIDGDAWNRAVVESYSDILTYTSEIVDYAG